MKILYAIQGTGNGHIARAQEILPLLKKYADVDLLISGHQSQIALPQMPKFQFNGISLLYNNQGGLSYSRTFFQNQFIQALTDIRNVPVENYDLILNDFEPVSAWACKLKKHKNIVGMSHQASMLFPQTPKPKKKNFLGELVLKNYAPAQKHYGFHFKSYHPDIFKPVIRSEIRLLEPQNKGFYIAYLPSFSDDFLIEKLNRTHADWKVFSKSAREIYSKGNVEIYPIDQTEYLNAFANCAGVLCNAGFETPAETLYLNKKLFVIPIAGQYEQECNHEALKEIGVPSGKELDFFRIQDWIDSDVKVGIQYADDTDKVIRKILGLT